MWSLKKVIVKIIAGVLSMNSCRSLFKVLWTTHLIPENILFIYGLQWGKNKNILRPI